jgi:hypothetical protein
MHDELIDLLEQVDRPGEIYASGDRPLTMPGLQLDGLGVVSLPLQEEQARKLIERCRQAPYGKGTQTLVDTQVRRSWELDPEGFQLTNPKWEQLIESIVGDVRRELGLKGRKLSASIYKLLVYEKGDFFLPHRDGEKLDGMVATLVIALPSVHEGGELIVYHEGRQHEIVFAGAASGHELSFAAFYADCQHEIRSLRCGYRLCLVYNLMFAGSRGKKGINAPSYGGVAQSIGKLLSNWGETGDAQKIAVTLGHRYTQDGLKVSGLKGIDQARAAVLFEAAQRADCIAHLALVTLWQVGTAEVDYDGFSHYRGYRSDYDSDVDESGGEYEMGEVLDHSLSASHWSDGQGRKVMLGEIQLGEDELVTDAPAEDWKLSEEEFEDYTGNAGMTLERWYHRAAVVIWPREQHFAVLCGAGTDAAIGGLESMVRQLKRASSTHREEQREACLTFAATIIESWQPGRVLWEWDNGAEADRNVFAVLLCALDAPDLLRSFVSQVMPDDGGIQLDKTFVSFCNRNGWGSFEQALTAVISTTSAESISRNAELLQLLCVQSDKKADRIALCTRLAERVVESLARFDEQSSDSRQVRKKVRSELICSLVRAMLAVGAENALQKLFDHALDRRDLYPLTSTHLAAVFALESSLRQMRDPSPAVLHWLAACRDSLIECTATIPEKPRDYRRPHKLSCNCGDCREMSVFLANPEQSEHRFAVRKDRRRHLHEMIRNKRCDLTHVTERRGSPYTLVCTKTTASYNRKCKRRKRDLQHLSRIQALEECLR